MNYDKLNIDELREVIDRAQQAIKARREQEIESLRIEVVELIRSKGFSVEDLFPAAKKTRTKAVPVYRDPENHEHTWSGRGRKPKWMILALEGGAKLGDLKI